MKTKHTKGKWIAKPHCLDLIQDVVTDNGQRICEVKSFAKENDPPPEEREANAKLIAASPQMLEALQEASFILTKYVKTYKHTMKKANDLVNTAIKKATE